MGARCSELGVVAIGAELGAKIYGAKLGAKIHGVELMPRLRHIGSHVNDTQKMALDLGANDHGTETCNLGTNDHGAEVTVYFFERIPPRVYL